MNGPQSYNILFHSNCLKKSPKNFPKKFTASTPSETFRFLQDWLYRKLKNMTKSYKRETFPLRNSETFRFLEIWLC